MTDIKWGPAIAVNGKRPGWLGSGEWRRVRTLAVGEWQTADIESPGDTIPDMDEWNWGDITAIRLPADHPHYRQPAPIDWSGELEAVHEDGRTIGVKVTREYSHGSRHVVANSDQPPEDWEDGWHKFDGTSFAPDDPWRIRNVPQPTPQADTKPDVTARMEALVRRMALADKQEFLAMGTGCREAYAEADAIVALLPEPVDPDLILARELACENSRWERGGDMWRAVEAGKEDHIPLVRTAYAALARGRELALAGETGK